MESLGTIVAILNEKLVLIKADKPLPENSEMTVFGRVSPEGLQERCGVPYLDFPKGKIRIVSPQTENFYLAERFRGPGERRRRFVPGFAIQSQTLLSSLLGGQEEVVDVPGPWSAEFDMAEALQIKVDTQVREGDHVGKD